MAIKAVNQPLYEITCDLCGTIARSRWIPENWENVNIALDSGGQNLHICQECQQRKILELFNRAKNPIVIGEPPDDA